MALNLLRLDCVTLNLLGLSCVTLNLLRLGCVALNLLRLSCVALNLLRLSCVALNLLRMGSVTFSLLRLGCVTLTLLRQGVPGSGEIECRDIRRRLFRFASRKANAICSFNNPIYVTPSLERLLKLRTRSTANVQAREAVLSTRGATARNNRGFMPLAACLRLGCFLLAVFLCDALLSEPAFCLCYPRLRFCPARLKRVDLFLASHIVVSCFYKGGTLGWVNTKLPIRELVFLRGKQETLDVLFFLAFFF